MNARIAAFSDYGDRVHAAGFGFIDFGVSVVGYSVEQNAQRAGRDRNPCGRGQRCAPG